MCVNKKLITNPYTKERLFVNCGKCSACLQQKANHRAFIIDNNERCDELTLFVTLTYSNDFLPYFRKSDIEQGKFIVYRQKQIRFTRPLGVPRNQPYLSVPKIINTDETILEDFTDQIQFDDLTDLDCFQIPKNIDDTDKVSVIYYKDIQLFFKRLRQTLSRTYNYTKRFTYFSCAEYGSKSKRAHFHLLITVPNSAVSTFKAAITKAWPFSSSYVTRRGIEIAHNASGYVASYVNCHSTLQPFFSQNHIKQNHSYSHHYGVGRKDFNFHKVLSSVESGNLHYLDKRNVNGALSLVTLPIPKYVISRFFPRFKGIKKLSDSQIYDIIVKPSKLSEYNDEKELNLTPENLHNITVMLENKVRFASERNVNRYDYAYYYVKAWNTYASNLYKDMFLDVVASDKSTMAQLYDNISLFQEKGFYHIAPTLRSYFPTSYRKLNLSPNLYNQNVIKSQVLLEQFYFKDKSKRVNAEIYENVKPDLLI